MSPECVIILLHELPGTHGVHDAPLIQRRKRYAVRSSARASDFYQAQNLGMNLSYVFTLSMMEEYDEETLLEYNGRKYDIVRAFETKTGGIELTVQRRETDD